MKKKNLTSLSEFINEKVGPKGSKKRDKYDKELEAFKIRVLIQQTRQENMLNSSNKFLCLRGSIFMTTEDKLFYRQIDEILWNDSGSTWC